MKTLTKTILKWVSDLEPTELVVKKDSEPDSPNAKAALREETTTIHVEVRVPKAKKNKAPAQLSPNVSESNTEARNIALGGCAVVIVLLFCAIAFRPRSAQEATVPAAQVPAAQVLAAQAIPLATEVASPGAGENVIPASANEALADLEASSERVGTPSLPEKEKNLFQQSNLQSKAKAVEMLVHQLNLEGYDISPVTELMSQASQKMDKGNISEAEELISQSHALASTKLGLRRTRPPGTEKEIQARLEGKVAELQRRAAEMHGKGKNPQKVASKMRDFEQLMKAGEVIKAETLLDEALEIAR